MSVLTSEPNVARQDPEITVQMKIMGEKLILLSQMAEVLEKRLNPILTPIQLREGAPTETKALITISPLADNLRAYNSMVETTTETLQRIMNGLEI